MQPDDKNSGGPPGDDDPYALTVLHTLDDRRPLAKRYTTGANGRVQKQAFTGQSRFSVGVIRAENIAALAAQLRQLESHPTAGIIRGAALAGTDRRNTRRLSNGPAATFGDVPRVWVMADMDAVPLPATQNVVADPAAAASYLMDMLTGFAPDLEGAAAVVQFSSSAGLSDLAEAEAAAGLPPRWASVVKPGNRTGAHIWFQLDNPESNAALKRWALAVNDRAGGKLIDTLLYQPIQFHYTAAPIFGQGLRDPLAGRRVHVIEGTPTATLDIPPVAQRTRTGGADFGGSFTGGFAARLDAIGRPGFHAEINAAVASYVATHGGRVDEPWLVEALQARIIAADPGHRSTAEIERYVAADTLQNRITWAMDREAEKRAAAAAAQPEPIDPTYPDRGVTLEEGEQQAAEAVRRFAGEMLDGSAPQHLVRVTVGVGKSHAAIEGLPALLQAARVGEGIRKRRAETEKATLQASIRAMAGTTPADAPAERTGPPPPPRPGNGAMFYLVPRHQLGDEIVARIRKAHPGQTVATWRGMDAKDPEIDGKTMCLDLDLTREAQREGLGATAPCVACPLRGECGYQRQRGQEADIWIAAHNLAFSDKPEGLPSASCIIIDEAFYQAGLNGLDGPPVQLLVAALDEDRTPNVTGVDRQRLLSLRALVKRAIEDQEPGQLHRDGFEREGVTADSLGEMRALEWQTKPVIDLSGCRDRGDIIKAMKGVGGHGFTRLRAVLATRLEAFLSRQDARCVGLELDPTAETGRGQGTAPAVKMAWRDDFKGWCIDAPKLLLDATTAPELIRQWVPDLVVTDIEVSAPQQHVIQVFDREFGREWFVKNAGNVARLADLVVVELAKVPSDVLVVVQKAVVDLLTAELERRFDGKLPDRLHIAWHGNLTGIDRWKAVDSIIVAGRPALNRTVGEWLAEIIRGGAVVRVADANDGHWPKVAAGLRMADGTGHRVDASRHPDPLVEAVRQSITEGGIIQAIGRARGVRREKRLRVTVLGNTPLPLTVTTATTWSEAQPSPVAVAMAEGAMAGRPVPLGAADLAAARPDLFKTAKAAEHALARTNPQTLIETPYKALGVCSARYRKAGGAKKWSDALVPVVGGQAALEQLLGVALAGFEWIGAQAAQDAAPPPPELVQPETRPINPVAGDAVVIVLGVDPPFDPLPTGQQTAPPQRCLPLLRMVPPPPVILATLSSPTNCARLEALGRRLFQVRPPRLHGDGMDSVRLHYWSDRCAQARRKHVAPLSVPREPAVVCA